MSKALPAGVPPTVDQRAALPAQTGTYVDEKSEFQGSLKLQKSVHIDGTIEGELECAATVTIGTSGKVTARIRAESVLIDGEVHGDIEARTEITLRKGARVYGDLKTEGIVIERGAVEGQMRSADRGNKAAARGLWSDAFHLKPAPRARVSRRRSHSGRAAGFGRVRLR
jgi:cytoskeletal protein CcmA (bactofilin family)